MLDQKLDDLFISPSTGSMKRKNAVENGVDGLSVREGVLDEADVACRGGRVEAQVGDCVARCAAGKARSIGEGGGGRDEEEGRAYILW